GHRRTLVQRLVDLHEEPRVLVGLPPDHYAVDMFKVTQYIRDGCDAAVQHHLELRVFSLHAVDAFVIKGRHATVVLRAYTFEDRLACVNDERLASRARDRFNELRQELVTVLVVDPDTGFHRYGHLYCRSHCTH